MNDGPNEQRNVGPQPPAPAADREQTQLDAHSIEIEQLKDDLTATKRFVDTAADNLRTQVDAQQIEIEQLTDDIAAQKKSTDAASDNLQTQVDLQQVEIVHLTDVVTNQTKVIDTALGNREFDDQKQQAYTEYLKAAAEDLGAQYNRERRAHVKTQQRLSDATDALQHPLPEDATDPTSERTGS